jgi:hypothetical protein
LPSTVELIFPPILGEKSLENWKQVKDQNKNHHEIDSIVATL